MSVTVTFKNLPIGDVVLDTDLVETFDDHKDAYYFIKSNNIQPENIKYISATGEADVVDMMSLSQAIFDNCEI